MDKDYEEVANCVQRHVCRPQGYCKSKRGRAGAECRFGYPKPNEEATRIVFEPVGTNGQQKATTVVKRNDQWINIHNRPMLHHWRANVDFQLILDAHAAMTYMVKNATKPEKLPEAGSLQAVMKAIIDQANPDSSAATAIRSGLMRTIGRRDMGQPACSRILMSGHHCESTFTFVKVSLELDVQEVTPACRAHSLTPSTLLMCFARRVQLLPVYAAFQLLQPNLIEFCRQFLLVRGKLQKQPKPQKVVVLTYPNYKRAPNTPQYKSYSPMQLIKYSPWKYEDIGKLFDDNQTVAAWEHCERTCDDQLRAYISTDLELRKRLYEAGLAIRQEENGDDNEESVDYLQQLQWQVASFMLPPRAQRAVPITCLPQISIGIQTFDSSTLALNLPLLQSGSPRL